ncbi:MAG TPA: prenyltransferase [Candidatus Caenarcaniphilales bacterium]|nr:prenyltransferase [Candidatus Caenarcaniphilales bacterium]
MVDLRTGVAMVEVPAGLARLAEFPFALLTFTEESGYPVSVAVDVAVEADRGRLSFAPPAGLAVPLGREISLTGSHINPRPGYGYDERRHVTVWGRAQQAPDGRLVLRAEAAWGWDEATIPFPEYVERTVGQSQRYLARLSAEVGRTVRPRLSFGWLFLRATRLPFLSATFIPVSIGIAIAAAQGFFDLPTAMLTLVGAAAVHLGLNVANDVFDTRLGADDKNVNPTQYSGGSRVIQYGLVSLRRMTVMSVSFYAIALAIGAVLLLMRGSVALLVIGVLGVVLSVGYTAPPLKLVYRGLGEITTAIGFGPLMLLGAYVVQTQGLLTPEPVVASLPIAILVALILYVNEVPDRPADARAGKRTLPVRLPRQIVINLYVIAVAAAFLIIVGGVLAGLLPIPAAAALLAVPLARRVYDGLEQYYESPYGLMAVMAVNVKLHMVVGALLLVAYLVVIAVSALALDLPLFLRWR